MGTACQDAAGAAGGRVMVRIELSDETTEDLRLLGERAAQISRRVSLECHMTISQSCQLVAQGLVQRLTRESNAAIRARTLGFYWLMFAMAVDAMHRR